jgi:hypothetical protein
VKLFVIVFFDRRHLLSDAGQLAYLVLNLVLKETHLIFKVVDAQVLEHDDVVISVLTEQTLEAYRAQIILAKGLYLFCGVYLTPTFLELTNLIVVHDIFECVTLPLGCSLFYAIQIIYYNYYKEYYYKSQDKIMQFDWRKQVTIDNSEVTFREKQIDVDGR